MRFININSVKLPMQKTSTLVSTTLKSTKNKQQMFLHFVDEPEPSDNLIQNILNYSKSLSIKKSQTVGFIEIVSN